MDIEGFMKALEQMRREYIKKKRVDRVFQKRNGY